MQEKNKEFLRDRAIKGANERWHSEIPKASHSGLLKIYDATIPCAVLKTKDGKILRLLTQSGMIKALGRSKGNLKKEAGGTLPVFVDADNLKPYITNEIKEGGETIVFRMPNGQKAIGYQCELLPMICGVYLDAKKDGKLLPQQEKLAEICYMLQKAFSTVGMVSLVDEATGYQKVRDSDALQEILQKYLSEELAKWAKRFPDEFYKQIFRLRGWSWYGTSKYIPGVVGRYTKDLVYERLASGLLEEMEERCPRDEEGKRIACLHQTLSEDYGIPALKEHFIGLIALMKISKNWNELKDNVNCVFPKQIEFEEKKD